MQAISALRFFLVLSSIAFLLILGSLTKTLKPLDRGLEFVTVPLQYFAFRAGVSFGDRIEALSGSFNAQKRIRELESQIVDNSSSQSRLVLLEEENKVLKEQLGAVSLLGKYRLIPANTISLLNNLVIDKGQRDNIRVGQVVVFKDNLIGVVTQTTVGTATIRTTKDPESKFLVYTQNGAKGVLSGNFGTSLLLDKVLQKEKLSQHELVLTAGEKIGEDSFIPPGLILGKISNVISEPTEAFLKGEVEPVISFEDLKIVFVLLPK